MVSVKPIIGKTFLEVGKGDCGIKIWSPSVINLKLGNKKFMV